MQERLIILSDLWGQEKSQWLSNYTDRLSNEFSLTFYDSCVLAGVYKSNYTQENLHQQFINGGIEKAVLSLSEYETGALNILAFSIGGVIGWKFGLINEQTQSLTSVSSTRLRKETKKPNGRLTLFFGEKDDYKPPKVWFDSMSLEEKLLYGKGHSVYTEAKFAETLSEKLIKEVGG